MLGLEVALASGQRTKSAGRVVKNVTGHDPMKRHTGASGTPGVLEAAWLRLRPQPESVALLWAELPDPATRWEHALAAARRGAARIAAVVDGSLAGRVVDAAGGTAPVLIVELAGAEGWVARERAALRDALGAVEIGAGARDAVVERLAALEVPAAGAEVVVRVMVLPTRVGDAAAALAAAGAATRAQPATGVVHARFGLSAGAVEPLEALLAAARSAAKAGGGSWRLEAAPLWAKAGRDVFGEPSEAFAVMRALKQRFDPGDVLNPGRFAGGL